jgi:hypothetical protein
MSAFLRSSPPLNFLTVQVTPFSSAHFKLRGSMAFAVFAGDNSGYGRESSLSQVDGADSSTLS